MHVGNTAIFIVHTLVGCSMARSQPNNATTTRHTNADVIDAFRAGTAFDGMENRTGTLRVEESRNGDLNLIGYGWMLYAQYKQSTDTVTAYTGHVDYAESVYNNVGTSTVRKHFNPNRYGSVGGIEHIADTISPASPTVGAVPDTVKDIGSWGKIREWRESRTHEMNEAEQLVAELEAGMEEEERGLDPLFQ